MFTHVSKDVEAAMFASMVRGIVLYHAHHLKLLVTYGDIATAVKVAPGGGQLAQALAMITDEDHKSGRPLTTAVVVSSHHQIPGTGFFVQARQLGHKFQDEDAFWRGQLKQLGVAPFLLSEAAGVAKHLKATADSGPRVVGTIGDIRRDACTKVPPSTPTPPEPTSGLPT